MGTPGVHWEHRDFLAALDDWDGYQPVYWVSPDKSGASHGYVAAGGPGFTGSTDTVGSVENAVRESTKSRR